LPPSYVIVYKQDYSGSSVIIVCIHTHTHTHRTAYFSVIPPQNMYTKAQLNNTEFTRLVTCSKQKEAETTTTNTNKRYSNNTQKKQEKTNNIHKNSKNNNNNNNNNTFILLLNNREQSLSQTTLTDAEIMIYSIEKISNRWRAMLIFGATFLYVVSLTLSYLASKKSKKNYY
jgi:hypothetical protein